MKNMIEIKIIGQYYKWYQEYYDSNNRIEETALWKILIYLKPETHNETRWSRNYKILQKMDTHQD